MISSFKKRFFKACLRFRRELARRLLKFDGRIFDRQWVYEHGNQDERKAYHYISRSFKQKIFKERQRLGKLYIAEHQSKMIEPDLHIPPETGLAFWKPVAFPLLDEAMDEARAVIKKRYNDPSVPSKGSIDFMGSAKKTKGEITFGTSLGRFQFHPNFVIPIIKYFGFLPVVFGSGITLSRNNRDIVGSSQQFHRDPEDITQIKVFIYLNDIDEETGPFMALPAGTSAVIAEQHQYRKGRMADEMILGGCGEDILRTFCGPSGTIVFADTNRCFHCGSRAGNRPRLALTIQYATPFSTWFPLFNGDGERRNLVAGLMNPNATEWEKRLLGLDM